MSDVHRGVTYVDLLRAALGRHETRVAFRYGGEDWTYAQLRSRISRLARVLERMGLGRGDGVAILAGNHPNAFCFQMAALSLGCRYTGLHPLGSLDDQEFVLEHGEIDVFAFDPELFAVRAREIAGRVSSVALASLGPGDLGEDVITAAGDEEDGEIPSYAEEDDLGYLLYTGGTTGKPKGVMISHRALVHNAFLCATEWEWPTEARLLVCTPITHAAGTMLVPALLRGGTCVLHTGFDPSAVLAAIETERITVTFLVPTMIYVLLDLLPSRPTDLSSLETLFYGASAASPARIAQAMKTFGPILMQGYGQTEALTTVTTLRKADHDPDDPERLATCGRPVAGVDVRLLDDDDREVGADEVGEICVRGRTVMDGYWKEPGLTAEAFRGGWLRTGDLARRNTGGFLTIVDRKKDMVVSGGFNVYPREVEDVLTSHPAVSMAAVIGVPDDKWGEAVKAIVVRASGTEVSADELRALVKERKGAVYAPKTVEFATEIPITPLGKPDKKALRARYWGTETRGVH